MGFASCCLWKFLNRLNGPLKKGKFLRCESLKSLHSYIWAGTWRRTRELGALDLAALDLASLRIDDVQLEYRVGPE